MELETAVIEGDLYYINQKLPCLGCDAVGNSYFFDDDYMSVTSIRTKVDSNGQLFADICDVGLDVKELLIKFFGFDHMIREDDGSELTVIPEELLILLCHQPVDPLRHPIGVKYVDGDYMNHDPDNLNWEYAEEKLDTSLWLKLFLIQSVMELLLPTTSLKKLE